MGKFGMWGVQQAAGVTGRMANGSWGFLRTGGPFIRQAVPRLLAGEGLGAVAAGYQGATLGLPTVGLEGILLALGEGTLYGAVGILGFEIGVGIDRGDCGLRRAAWIRSQFMPGRSEMDTVGRKLLVGIAVLAVFTVGVASPMYAPGRYEAALGVWYPLFGVCLAGALGTLAYLFRAVRCPRCGYRLFSNAFRREPAGRVLGAVMGGCPSCGLGRGSPS